MPTQAEIKHLAPPTQEQSRFHNTNLAILLGGTISAQRKAEARSGQKPRIDVAELEAQYNIPVYGFDWLVHTIQKNRLTQRLLKFYSNRSSWLALFAFKALQDTDVVYATGEDVGIPFAFLLRLLGRKRPLLIMRLEHPAYGKTHLRRWIYHTYYRLAMRRINLTMCRTHSHVNLLKTWGVNQKKILLVPETTDTTFFNPESTKLTTNGFQLPTKPYIVSAGLEMRDYDTLIEATDGLPVQVIIGAGSPWSKLNYAPTPELLPKNVTVATFNPLQMRELYRYAQCVVVPVMPTQRSCGITVVLEAWAMQKPVIASRTEGLLSYIDDRQTGIFAEPQNAEDLRQKILYVLSHPTEAQEWGVNGRQRVTSELNLERYLHEVLCAAESLQHTA